MTCLHLNRAKTTNPPLFSCKDCGLVFVNSQEFDPAVRYKDFYQNEIAARFPMPVEYLVRFFRFVRALKIFTLYPKAKSILDIGSGRGFMLYYLKKYFGYRIACGTQISKPAIEFSRKKLGLQIYDRDFLDISFDNSFDIITLWHVLEHVADPQRYIEKTYKTLNPGGRLIIEVPNFDSWTRRLTGKYWLGLDLNHHLYFFTPASLSKLVKKYGYKITKTHTYSLEYSTFLSAQSIISAITRTDHLFYNFMQDKKFSPVIIYHFFLFALISPVCFIINLLFYFSKRGEVLLISAFSPTPSKSAPDFSFL